MTLWQKLPIDIIETLFNYLDINSRINLILSAKTLKDVIFKEEYIQRSLISVYFKTLKNNLTDSSFNSLVLENILHYNNNFIFDEEFFKNIHLYINTFNNINDLSYGKKYFPNTIPCHCSASYAFYLNGDVIILDCSNYLVCSFQNEQLDYNRHFSDINFFKYNGSIKEMSRETTTTTTVADAETTTALTSELKNSKAYTLVKCNVKWPNELLYRKIKIVSLNNTILPLILNIDQIFPIFYNSFLLVSDAKSIYILEIKYDRCEEEKSEEDNNMEMEVNKCGGDGDDNDDDDGDNYNNKRKSGSNLDLTNIVFKKYSSNIFESVKTIDITEGYAVVYLQISNNEHTVLYLKKSKDENNKTLVNVIGEKKIFYCEKLISFNMNLGIFFYNTEFASRLVFLDYDIDNINNDVNSCIKTTLFFNKKIKKAVCLSKYIYLTIRRLKLTIVKVSANLENRLEIESYTNLTVYGDNGDTVIVNDISFIENSKLICLKLLRTNKIFFTTRLLNCFLKHEENNFEEYERNRYSEMKFYKNNLDTEYINYFRVPSFTLPIPLEINCLTFGLVKFYEYNGHVINSNTMRVYKTKLDHLNSVSPYRLLSLDGEMNLKIY